jgi:hypothetical protein
VSALPLVQKQVRAAGNVGVSELPCDVTPTRSPHVGHCSPLKASERPLDRMWHLAVTSASPVVRSDPDVFGGTCRPLGTKRRVNVYTSLLHLQGGSWAQAAALTEIVKITEPVQPR